MALMEKPVISVVFGKLRGFDDENVFGIVVLGSLCKVIAARYDGLLVDYHDLVVCDGMLIVDECLDAGMGGKVSGAVLLASLGLVQNDFNVHAPLVGVNQRPGNR